MNIKSKLEGHVHYASIFFLIPVFPNTILLPSRAPPITMSEQKTEPTVKLGYENWHIWDHYVQSAIRRKNASIAFDPEPTNPRTQQQVVPAMATGATTTPSITVSPQPTAEVLKTDRDELKEWNAANNIAHPRF
jgi:hypothetical protein